MTYKLTPDKKDIVFVKEPNVVQKNMDSIKDENVLNPKSFKKVVGEQIHIRNRWLKPEQKIYIKARMRGRTARQAAILARPDLTNPYSLKKFSEKTEQKPIVKRTFNAILVKAGITKELLATKLMEGLDANSMQGQGKYSEILPDYNARHKYLTTAIELKGLKPKEEMAHTYDPLTTKLLEMNIDQLKKLVGGPVLDGEIVEDNLPELKVLNIKDKYAR
jgi:hypothetical protein